VTHASPPGKIRIAAISGENRLNERSGVTFNPPMLKMVPEFNPIVSTEYPKVRRSSVLLNVDGCDFFLIVNGLKDSLHQPLIWNARVFLLFSHYRSASLGIRIGSLSQGCRPWMESFHQSTVAITPCHKLAPSVRTSVWGFERNGDFSSTADSG
jgi:hypothetical protein